MKLAWLLPTMNEAPTITDLVKRIQRLQTGDIYVYDKSSDETASLARASGATVIRRQGHGKGEAVREAIRDLQAKAELIAMIDGDGTYDPADILSLMPSFDSPDVGLVIGARQDREDDAMSLSHRLGNWILTGITNLRYGTSLSDSLSGFRVLRIAAVRLELLRAKGFDIEVDLIKNLTRNGYRITEEPVTYRPRSGTKSKLRMWDALAILRRLVF